MVLSEETRRLIFFKFWNKIWQQNKEYVKNITELSHVKRRRGVTYNKTRNYSIKYNLKNGIDKK